MTTGGEEMTNYRWLVEEHEHGIGDAEKIQFRTIVVAHNAEQAFALAENDCRWAFKLPPDVITQAIVTDYLWQFSEGDVSYEIRRLEEFVGPKSSIRQRIYQPHHATDRAAELLKDAATAPLDFNQLAALAAQWADLASLIDRLPNPDRSDEPGLLGILANLLTLIDGEDDVVQRMIAVRSYVKLQQHRQLCTPEGL